MPSDASRTPKRSWKGSGGSPARADASNYAWRKEAKPEAEAKLPQSRAFKIAVAAASCVALVGLIVALILMIQPVQPACLTLIGADYAANLAVPHNAFGFEGLRGLQRLGARSKSHSVFGPKPMRLTRDEPRMMERSDDWDAAIADLLKKKAREQTFIVVLALHGGSDPDDGPYLLPGGAGDPKDRLPLKKVIADLGKLKDKNKVLILEAAGVPADWRLGMLRNDFARQLKELEPEIAKVPNLWVLSASGPDERCWASEGLRQTIFSHFVIEGLAGRAAGSDGRVDLDELYHYVRDNVRQWAWNARGAVQEPVLLPRGKLNDGELSDRARKVVLVSAGESTPYRAPSEPSTAALEPEWRRFQAIASQVPPPWVYSPRQWRAYRALLVRYDELIRAGYENDPRAKDLRQRLDVLASNIRDRRALDGLTASDGNSLVFDAVKGEPVDDPAATDARNEFAELEVAPEANLRKVWAKLQGGDAKAAEGSRRPLRARVDDFLIGRAAQDPARSLGSSSIRLEVTCGNDLQPAEAHFLRMLDRYARGDGLAPMLRKPVGQALAVRRLAERAALGIADRPSPFQYAEQVLPWTRPLVEGADDRRRQAEDLLFSTEPTTWEEAGRALAVASTLYRRAIDRAGPIRDASLLLDRVLADLPDLSRWLAHRLPAELNDPLPGAVEALWEKVHALDEQLDAPGPGAGAGAEGDADLEPIGQLAKAVEQGFTEARGAFDRARAEVEGDRQAGDWEAADATADVAVPDPDDLEARRKVWRRLANIGRRDVEDAKSDRASGDDPGPTRRDNGRALGMKRAAVEGRMALAVLGRRWFDDPSFKDRTADFKGMAAWVNTFQGQEDGATRLAVAGDEIGVRWRGLAPRVDQATSGQSDRTTPAFVLAALRAADRAARLLDGAGASAAADTAPEATALYRKRRVHDLLIWLADRTRLDHWYDEDPKAKAYYLIAGEKYLADADHLVEDSALVKEARARLNRPSALKFAGDEPIVLTSEWSKSARYRVEDVGEVPPGTPVLSATPGDSLVLDQPDEKERRTPVRRARDGKPSQPAEFLIACPMLRALEKQPAVTRPRVDEATFKVRGFFRGQVFEAATDVHIHPLAEVTVLGPEATNSAGAVAVRAPSSIVEQYGEGTGAIAIILDCSGSMVQRDAQRNIVNATRFNNAKRALIDVLRTIPERTAISIWTYGQLRGPMDGPESRADELNPRGTIRKVFPASWDGRRWVSQPPAQWDRAQMLPGVERTLAALEPFHGTPMVDAMIAAKPDLDGAGGFRTLLVLTDGADSIYDFRNPKNIESSRKAIRGAFAGSGILVNMVLFELSPEEKKPVIAQFEPALKALEPPGDVLPANAEQLANILRSSLKQKLVCKVWKDDAEERLVTDRLDVTAIRDEPPDEWATLGRDSATYTIRVQTDRSNKDSIQVDKGDRLIVDLLPPRKDRPYNFERAIYSDFFRDKDPFKGAESQGWRLAFLENRGQLGTARLQLFAALERTARGDGNLRLRRPRLAWFELTPEFGSPGDFAVRWRERPLYPAPTYQFDVPDWPLDPAGKLGRPTARAWWTDQEVRASATLTRKADFNAPRDLDERSVSVEMDEVVIESVRAEDHYVEARPGAKPELAACLVVRLRYPKDKPCWVDPERLGLDAPPSGHEHRFYTAAGRYTGLFWPVTDDQVEDQLGGLSLVSLRRFQERAQERKYALEVKLRSPQAGTDKAPEPPAPPKIPE